MVGPKSKIWCPYKKVADTQGLLEKRNKHAQIKKRKPSSDIEAETEVILEPPGVGRERNDASSSLQREGDLRQMNQTVNLSDWGTVNLVFRHSVFDNLLCSLR